MSNREIGPCGKVLYHTRPAAWKHIRDGQTFANQTKVVDVYRCKDGCDGFHGTSSSREDSGPMRPKSDRKQRTRRRDFSYDE